MTNKIDIAFDLLREIVTKGRQKVDYKPELKQLKNMMKEDKEIKTFINKTIRSRKIHDFTPSRRSVR